jgi:hypothetical protein
MNARRPQPASGRAARGAEALRAALRRLRAASGALAQPPANGHWPPPQSAWERATEARLSKIETKLNNQNRLLLITLVSILADVMLGLAR